jgi:hypothetical protein
MTKVSLSVASAIVLFSGLASISANASTLVYYRMGDDTSFVTDSSGNGNTLTASDAVEMEDPIPATGDGSAFSDPIPQTGDSNDYLASFDGTQNMAVADPFGSLTSFTAEAYINLASFQTSTQYVMAQWSTSTNGRSWGIGVAASGGTGSASGNELFLLMGKGSAGSEVVPLGLTLTLDTDFYIAVGYDGTTGTDDINFYYQDLTAGSSLVSTTISSGITTSINNTSDVFRVGAYGKSNSAGSFLTGFIDEVRVSDTILSSSELLAVPEPSSFALISGLFALGCMARRQRRA